MWTSPSTNSAFEHCRESTNMLISAPSNGEPGRLDWSAELPQIAAKICQPLLNRPPLGKGGNARVLLFFCNLTEGLVLLLSILGLICFII